MTKHNPQQVKDWKGQSGEQWVVHQAWLDQMLATFGDEAIDAAKVVSGEDILDIGCGAGTSSFALTQMVQPSGHVTGLDISDALIDRAKGLSQGQSNLHFMVADATMAPLPVGQFDLLFSRFGVMFFDDPMAAFRHLRRTLKPDGRLAFVCWREAEENDWVRLPMGAIRGLLPPQPTLPANASGPFSFGDSKRVEAILSEAGFTDITFRPFDHDIVFGQGDTAEDACRHAVEMAFEVGPLSRALAGASEELRHEAAQAVHAAFSQKIRGTEVIINGAAWIVTADNGEDV